MNERLKNIILKKLNHDFENVKKFWINDEIWFIGESDSFWYFICKGNGTLLLRLNYSRSLSGLFSLEPTEIEVIISEWLKNTVDYKVYKTWTSDWPAYESVDVILNHKKGM